MQPNYEAPSTVAANDYRADPAYRRLRGRVRWAGVIGYFSGVVNLIFGYLLFDQSKYDSPGDAIYNVEFYGGIVTMVIGILLLILSFLIMRHVRWAAGAAIALGIINILSTLYSVSQGGAFTPIIGSAIYIWLNITAYNTIPDLLSYEKP